MLRDQQNENTAPDTIIQPSTSVDRSDEIETSKKKLFRLCVDGSTTSTWCIPRQGDKKDVNNMRGILKLVQEKGREIPTFVALDLNRLPPLARIHKTQNEVDLK